MIFFNWSQPGLCISRRRNRDSRRQSLVTWQCTKAPTSALQRFDLSARTSRASLQHRCCEQHLCCNNLDFWNIVSATERFRLLPLCRHLRVVDYDPLPSTFLVTDVVASLLVSHHFPPSFSVVSVSNFS